MRPRAQDEQRYMRALTAEVRRIKAITMPAWRAALREIERQRTAARADSARRADAEPPDPRGPLWDAIERARVLLLRLWEPRIDFRRAAEPMVSWALGAARMTAPDRQRIALIDAWATDRMRTTIDLWAGENAALVRSLPETALARLSRVVQSQVRQGMDVRRIAEVIEETFAVTESRARLIARDQAAKLNSTIQRDSMRESGATSYTWRTSSDERVRPGHVALHGTVHRWVNPPDTGRGRHHPGMDIQCRCVAIPIYDDLPSEAEMDAELAALGLTVG